MVEQLHTISSIAPNTGNPLELAIAIKDLICWGCIIPTGLCVVFMGWVVSLHKFSNLNNRDID